MTLVDISLIWVRRLIHWYMARLVRVLMLGMCMGVCMGMRMCVWMRRWIVRNVLL